MSTRRVVLDGDPGHDDAIAWLLAAGSPQLEVLALTTVAGNQTLAKVSRNALAVAELAGITAPVAAGADRPLERPPMIAPDIHGESGLDGPELPEPTRALDPRHAADLIVDVVMAHEPGSVTLVPTGPLTTIALAARREPRVVQRVREVVLMGGAVHGGNWSPVAEFNIAVDPEAAHEVFTAGWPVLMCGLDVTHQALATPEVVARIAAVGTRAAAFTVELLAYFGDTYRAAQGFDAPPVHDPVAVAAVIDRSLLTTVRAPIDVERSGELTTGMTVVDLRSPAPAGCTTSAAMALDVDGFWDLVVDALARLP